MRFKMLFLCLFFCADAFAQSLSEEEILLESMTDRVDDDYDFSELADRLLQYRQNPLNINTATQTQLAELFILSPQQVASLLDHIRETDPLLSPEELQAVDHFDLPTIRRLLPYITIRPTAEKFSPRQILALGKNDLMFRYGQTLQKQLGYTDRDGSRYLGGPQRYLIRYRFNYVNRLLVSLNAEKDAGEPFFAAQNKQGFDFYSGSLAWSPQHSAIKKVIAGDFALQFGQGLSLYTGLSFGKSADISMIPKAGRGLAPYTSTNEVSFFRGISATIGTKNLNFTPFFSYRKMDASIDRKTGLAGSLQQSGYHRTLTEFRNKGSVAMLVTGADLNYSRGAFSLGGNFYHAKTDQLFAAGQRIYDRFDFSGNRLSNGSIYGSLSVNNTYFFAEAAKSLHGGTAFLAGSISSLTDKISVTLLARNYGRDYRSMFNQ
ncbi:MAG: hypothetical protein INR69_21010, partial [Mucilaginibacter polytrichastri]|nr:hypothetical protein [Mucilaginibacter polytrichastri]